MDIQIIKDKCTGCSLCERKCPFGAISMSDGLAVIDYDKCTLCGVCVESCKFAAIELDAVKKSSDLSAYSGIMVFTELRRGEIADVTYELLGKARELCGKSGKKCLAMVLGADAKRHCDMLISRGADKVYYAEDPLLENFNDEAQSHAFVKIVEKVKPEIILIGATTIGRAIAPRAAILLKTGLTADCTELDLDEKGNLVQVRPAFGGNIMATILCENARPQMATVRPNVMKKSQPAERTGEIIEEKVDFTGVRIRARVIETVSSVNDEVDIQEADIIVSGGRGVGCKDNFEVVRQLASVLGGVVGASRGAVDSEWISYAHQVGQTGKTVQPKLYIACGISGAIQHLVGMRSSDMIIAVNKDKTAPIFSVADLGVVGNLQQVLPELIKRIKKHKGQ